jgi:hypothetical protein
MRAVVIDTNVPVVANGKSVQADMKCERECIDALEETKKGRIVVLDNGQRILSEYRRYLSPSGQPGAGDAFFKWLWSNQANPSHCEMVQITPYPDDAENFEEFPIDLSVVGFDPADRKFVAVARASRSTPQILFSVERGWWRHREALSRHGVTVGCLCPHLTKDEE